MLVIDATTLRHEIAFVFGQLLSPHSVPSLLDVLRDDQESDMVRHEAAEALGGIATHEVLPQLIEWMNREDAPRVVRESCEVAIDMWEVRFCSDRLYTLHMAQIPSQNSMKILPSSNMQMVLELKQILRSLKPEPCIYPKILQ
jgi:deoxyhypusine monooxygenase